MEENEKGIEQTDNNDNTGDTVIKIPRISFYENISEKRKERLQAADAAFEKTKAALSAAPKTTKLIQELLSAQDYLRELLDEAEIFESALMEERRRKSEMREELRLARQAMEGKEAAYYVVQKAPEQPPPQLLHEITPPREREFDPDELLKLFNVR